MKNAIIKSLASLTILGVVSCSPEFVDPQSLNNQVKLPDAKVSVRSFDLMNHTMSTLTGISVRDLPADNLVQNNTIVNPGNEFNKGAGGGFRNELPANNNLSEFNSSHQGAIVRIASAYCDRMVERYYAAQNPKPFPDGQAAPTTVAAVRQRLDGIVSAYYDDFWGACSHRPELPDVQREVASLVGGLDTELGVNTAAQARNYLKMTCAVFLSSSCVTMF